VVFLAMLQDSSQMTLDCEIEVRSAGRSDALGPAIRQAVAEVDPNLGVTSTRTLRDQVTSTFGTERLTTQFVAVFAGLGLLLATIRLYGVVAHGVARRISEIGVRIALGAARADVLWLILRETLARLGIGVALGLAAAIAAGRIISSQLFGVSATDPSSFAIAAMVLTAVAVTASLLPALRAMRIDPVTALRSE
jgi:putative ABC transport system permease protein